jgi:hypothetical protein
VSHTVLLLHNQQLWHTLNKKGECLNFTITQDHFTNVLFPQKSWPIWVPEHVLVCSCNDAEQADLRVPDDHIAVMCNLNKSKIVVDACQLLLVFLMSTGPKHTKVYIVHGPHAGKRVKVTSPGEDVLVYKYPCTGPCSQHENWRVHVDDLILLA